MNVTERATDGLRARVLRGLGWKVVSFVSLQLSRLIVVVVLARLLSPRDIGLAAMVLAFSSLILVFSDLALGAALIQRRELSERDRSTVFWTSVGAGTLFMLIGFAVAGPISAFYGEPEVRALFLGFSLSFLVTALGSTHSALLVREMNFRSLELRLIAGNLAGAGVGIGLAAAGFGAWAIIAQQLAVAGTSTLLLWVFSGWRPHFVYSRESLRILGRFGGNVFGTRLLFYLSRNADNLLIGRFLGPAALGAYSIAYNIMLVPFEKIAGPVQDVLFPAFSRMQDLPTEMGSVWLRAIRFVAALTLPAMLGLAVVADDFVHVVLGSRWEAAVPVIQILAGVGFLQSLVRLNSSILQARDRTGLLFRWSLLVTGANVVAFAVGVQWGIVGVAAAYALSNILLQPVNVYLTARTVGISLLEFTRNLSGVTQAGLAMAVCVLGVRTLLVHEGLPPAARLLLSVLVGLAVYLPLVAWRAPEIVGELTQLRRGGPGRAAAAAQT